jgi:hypothetical protein
MRPVAVIWSYINNRVGGNSAVCAIADAQTEIFRPIGSSIPT